MLYKPPKFAPCLTFLLPFFSDLLCSEMLELPLSLCPNELSIPQATTLFAGIPQPKLPPKLTFFQPKLWKIVSSTTLWRPSGCSVQNLGNAGRRAAPTNATLGTLKFMENSLLEAIAPDTWLLCLKTVSR
jgi:hypothetical protein